MGLSLKRIKKGIADVASRSFDQVNTFDNNRTFQQRTPTANRSVVQQLGNNAQRIVAPPAAAIGRNLNAAAQAIPEIGASSPARFLNNAVIRPIKTTDTHFGQALQGQNPYTGNLRQQSGQALQDVINATSVLPIGKGAQLATKGIGAVREGAQLGAKLGAGYGAAQGVATANKQNLNTLDTLKTVGVNTAGGALGGAVLGAAAPAVGVVAKPTAKLAVREVKQAANPVPRTTLNDQKTLADLSSHYTGDVKLKPKELSTTITKAREIAAKHGKEAQIVKGSEADRIQGINDILDTVVNRGKSQAQIGAIGKNVNEVGMTPEEIIAYHGSTNNKLTSLMPGAKTGLNEKRNLIYLTEDAKTAGHYAKTRGSTGSGLGELSDSSTGKVYKVKVKGKVLGAYDRQALEELKNAPTFNDLSGKTKNMLTNDTGLSADLLESNPELTQFLRQNGITAVRAGLPNGGKATELAVINHDNLSLGAPKPTVKLKSPETAKVKLKERGFAGNISRNNEKAANPTAQAVVEAIPGYKPITNAKTISKAASEVNKDSGAAFARIVTKPQLNTADDVATGNLLLRQAVESGDVESAIQLGTKLGVDGTKLGQAVQAYATYKKTTPEGIVTYASKRAGKAGRDLDPQATQELITAAKRIAEMPEGLERSKATRELLGRADKLGRTWKDNVNEILSAPRALMATADFSAPLRQGAILGSRFPNQFRKAFTESAKYMFNPKYYEKEMYELTQRPRYPLMKARKLSVDAGENLTGTEEQFLSNILEGKVAKKLGVGHIVAASDRAYSGFLTKLRADVFDKVLDDAQAAGVKFDNKELNSLTKYINSASGRGEGNITNQVSRLQVLFSARLWKSRLDTLNPAYYARLDPTARKYALQSAASFAAIATTVLGLAKASGMADVNADPRSADFGKIKVGNTRYDILGGLQQNIRLAAQLITGEKINSETGEIQTLGADRGFGKPSRLDLLYQFVENKENPIIAFGTKALRGTDPAGNPVNLATEAGKLAIPLNAQSVYSTAQDTGNLPKAIAMNAPGTFGIGVQTYGKDKTKDKPKPGDTKDEPKTVAQYEEEKKQKKTEFKNSLSPEDYDLQSMSKSDKKKLVSQGIVSQEKIDGLDNYVKNKKEELGLNTDKVKEYKSINKSIAPHSQHMLREYANLKPEEREKKRYSENTYDYKLLQARYENDKANGKISKAEDVNKQEALQKAKVGSKYSKDTRELFGLNKNELADLLESDPNGNKIANELFAYDKELTAAGLQKKNKFGAGYIARSGSGGRTGSDRVVDPLARRVSIKSGSSSVRPRVSSKRVSFKSGAKAKGVDKSKFKVVAKKA